MCSRFVHLCIPLGLIFTLENQDEEGQAQTELCQAQYTFELAKPYVGAAPAYGGISPNLHQLFAFGDY